MGKGNAASTAKPGAFLHRAVPIFELDEKEKEDLCPIAYPLGLLTRVSDVYEAKVVCCFMRRGTASI